MRLFGEYSAPNPRLRSPLLWSFLGLGLLLLFDFFFLPGFFRVVFRGGRFYGVLLDILNYGSEVMLLSLGMTLVIATGGVDLSVGSIMAVAAALAAVLIRQAHVAFALAVPAALGGCLILGAWNGLLVAGLGLQPIVATLILMVAGRGVAMLFTGGQIITFDQPAFVFLGNGALLGLPFPVWLVAVVFAATAGIARGTALGSFIEMTGDNETAARYCGIRVRTLKLAVYAFSGFCAGLAGLIAAANIKAADAGRVGRMMELDAIFAVVVGGTALTGGRFSLLGAIVGALLIQTLTVTMYDLGLPPAVAPVPKALVILGVCLLQSPRFRGQLGRAAGFWRKTA